MSEIDELRTRAEAATPGPWECDGGPFVFARGAGIVQTSEANAAYISAASPDVILRLLDRLEKAETGGWRGEPDAWRWKWAEASTWHLSLSEPDAADGKVIEPLFVGGASKDGWKLVPEEATKELLRDASSKHAGDKQVLCYENGEYYNAWLVFDPYEGGWLWMNEADSEPNPSHYMILPEPPADLNAGRV